MAQAKARPGSITFNSNGYGTSQHIGFELLKKTAAIQILHTPSRTPTLPDILGGHVTASFANIMVALPNVQAWYSCDRETGLPETVPPGVRIAWLMADADDAPPASADLVFRVRGLRRDVRTDIAGVRVCPTEDGQSRPDGFGCDACRRCWSPPASLELVPLAATERRPP